MLNVGGIYLTEVKPGTPGVPAQAVAKNRQQESLKWVLNELKTCDWIEDEAITSKFSMRVGLAPILQYYTILELFDTHQNVILSSYLAGNGKNAYTLQNWLDDMYNGIWESTIKYKTPTACDRILQDLYVTFLTGIVTKKSQLVKVKSFALDGDSFLPSVVHLVTFGLDETGVLAENIDVLRAIEEEQGRGYVASQMGLDKYGPAGYKWQYRVNLRTIDHSKTMLFGEVKRVEKLLKNAAASASGDAKVHYESMLYKLQSSMKAEK